MIKLSYDQPIYCQIMDIILKDIICGNYKPGEQVPSIRALSDKYGVNPNTIQKALRELSAKGYIKTKTTVGKFITEDAEFIDMYRQKILKSISLNIIDEIKSYGFTIDEVLKYINESRGRNNE